DDQRFGDHQPDRAILARLGNVHPFQQRVIANHIRRVTMRNLPRDGAPVQIDGREGPVWRFDDWQSLDKRAASAFTAAGGRGGRCARASWRRRRRLGLAAPWLLREISGAAETRTLADPEWLPGPAQHVLDIRESFWRLDQSDRRNAGI